MPSSHVVVFQYETRKENYLLALMKKNQEFCVNHGYRYYCMSHAVPFPAYWVKVWIGLDLMITMNEGDILMWLDSDAVFVNPSTRIESLFDHLSPSTVFLASADPHPWPSIFNAGVFAIKVTPQIFCWCKIGSTVTIHLDGPKLCRMLGLRKVCGQEMITSRVLLFDG